MPLQRRCRSLVYSIWSIVLTAGASAAQNATASVSGIVSGLEGRGLAQVVVSAGTRIARTDSLGRYSLDGIDPGQVRILVRAIGFTRADSTITLRSGDRLHWDVTLRVDPALREFRRQLAIADSQNSTAGRVD